VFLCHVIKGNRVTMLRSKGHRVSMSCKGHHVTMLCSKGHRICMSCK